MSHLRLLRLLFTGCAAFVSSVLASEVRAQTSAEMAAAMGTSAVVLGTPMRGHLATHTEVDWFIVDLPAGLKEFGLEIRQTAPEPLKGQWQVEVYDLANTRLASFSSWLVEPEYRNVEINGPGRYLIAVSADSFHSLRDYVLTPMFKSIEAPTLSADFTGIWLTDQGRYVSIQQSGAKVVAAVLGNFDASTGWEALTGSVSGNQLSLTTRYGDANKSWRMEMVSYNTLLTTQVSCSPVTFGIPCDQPNGSVFFARKAF